MKSIPLSSSFPRNWSDVPPELLRLIASRLPDFMDLISFQTVCRSWRHVSLSDPSLTPLPPCLLLAYSDDAITFFNPSSLRPINLECTTGKAIYSTAHGWLVFAWNDEENNNSLLITLVNPITGSKMYLPTLDTSIDTQNLRVFRSTNPLANSSSVLSLWANNKLFILRIGKTEWNLIDLGSDWWSRRGDLVYCNGCFFLSNDQKAKIMVIDNDSFRSVIQVPVTKDAVYHKYCMVVSAGELFVAVEEQWSEEYLIFKLIRENRDRWHWFRGNDGWAFFISDGLSIGVDYTNGIRSKDDYIRRAFDCVNNTFKPCRQRVPNVHIAQSNFPFIFSNYEAETEDESSTSEMVTNTKRYTWFIPDGRR